MPCSNRRGVDNCIVGYTIIIKKTEEFDRWLRRLKDGLAKDRIKAAIYEAGYDGGFADVKYVGKGVYEARCFSGRDTGCTMRLGAGRWFCCSQGATRRPSAETSRKRGPSMPMS